jgi:hypothetical protein
VPEGQRPAFYQRLNWIHELVFKDRLRRAQQPTQAEINAALGQTIQHLRRFLSAAEQLHLDWLADQSPGFSPGPLTLFYLYPRQLRALADHAWSAARRKGDVQLGALTTAADRLACYLTQLDHASVDQTSKELHEAHDYAVRDLVDAVRVARRLELAVRDAVEKGKKRGGPRPRPDVLYAVICLGDLVEDYGGVFTNNPRQKTEYKGRPQTPGGRFVAKFLALCDPSIAETKVNQWMADAVEFRNQRQNKAR